MKIEIISQPISLEQLKNAARNSYGDMVKIVADVERRIIALGGEMHADAEAVLLNDGSRQQNLWGFNVYPEKSRAEWIEFTSLINIRPRANNRSMEIQDPVVQKNILDIIDKLIAQS